MADRALRMLLGILVGAWVARYLGPDQFGELAYVFAFVAFFQAFSLLGLDGLTVRDIAKDRAHSGVVLGTVFRLRLGAASLGWVTACGLIGLLRPGDTVALFLVAIVSAGMLFQTADVVDLWFQSQTQSRRTVLAKVAAYLIANGAKVALIVAEAPLWAFAAVQVLDTGLAALFLIWAYRRFPAHNYWSWDSAVARRLLEQCWPFILSGLAIMVYMRIDQIMLREMVGDRELGIYSAALPFSQAWYFIPMTICASLLPTMSQEHVANRTLFFLRLQKLFTLLAWLAIALAVGLALLSNWLVTTLLGAAYEATARVLSVHVVTNIFIFLGVAQGQWILNENRGRVSLAKTVIGATTSVAANLILIPRYGALGAAIAAVIAQAVSAVFSNWMFAPEIFSMQMRALFPIRHISRATQ
jgi:O-antigen/teichoic acid export membrane protein